MQSFSFPVFILTSRSLPVQQRSFDMIIMWHTTMLEKYCKSVLIMYDNYVVQCLCKTCPLVFCQNKRKYIKCSIKPLNKICCLLQWHINNVYKLWKLLLKKNSHFFRKCVVLQVAPSFSHPPFFTKQIIFLSSRLHPRFLYETPNPLPFQRLHLSNCRSKLQQIIITCLSLILHSSST